LDDLGRQKATVEDYLTNISRQLANNPLFTGKWSKLVEKVSKVFIRKILSGNYLAGFQHLQPPEQIEVIRTDFVTESDFAAAPMLDISTERLQKGLQTGHSIAMLVQNFAEVPPFILLITKAVCQQIRLPKENFTNVYETTRAYQVRQAGSRYPTSNEQCH
jgi:hypothetical protein